MASLPGPGGLPQDRPTLHEGPWRSPLVPVALALTAGVVTDRLAPVPFGFSLLLAGCALAAFVFARLGDWSRVAPAYLLLAVAALGAAHHHARNLVAPDDIALAARDGPRPVVLRGALDDEPRRVPARARRAELYSVPPAGSATVTLQATDLILPNERRPVSGRVRLLLRAAAPGEERDLLTGLHAGDEVEARGTLRLVEGPANPGEFDVAEYALDHGARAVLAVRQGPAGVALVRSNWRTTPAGWLGWLRSWCHARLAEALAGSPTEPVARALVLGEGAPMTRDDWARYVRTGVVHVLAISGQHLVVVALFLWWVIRLLGVRQRPAAVAVAAVLFTYALLTGGRPPAMRAGVGAVVICLGLVMRRPPLAANQFALAWLVVALLNPGDVFDTGCQLSFLSVAVLCWAVPRVLPPPADDDPVERLIDQASPAWRRLARVGGRAVIQSYALCLVVWLAITPLVAYRTGALALSAVLLGPPLTLLTSVALISGLALLPLAGWGVAAAVPAWFTATSLWACDWLVDLADGWSAHAHVGVVPLWWVLGFYSLAIPVVCWSGLRRRWRWFAPAGLAWGCLFLALGAAPRSSPELRCTFLAVGHGGCTVLELPDGRVLLYDAGAIGGPEVTRRTILPYLWSRRIARVDDIVLSHADLDHYNGLIDLLDHVPVGRVLWALTFTERQTRPAQLTVAAIESRGVAVAEVAAGDRLSGGGVSLDVLHPPSGFRAGNENARSVVLRVRHAGHTLLLTGDLEGEGLSAVLRQRPGPVDVLQAPHHGSARVDVEGLLRWCEPELVVSCQGPPRSPRPSPYHGLLGEQRFWATHEQGAVTLRSGPAGLTAEAFRTGRRRQLR